MPDEYLHPTDVRLSHVLTRVLDIKKPETDVYDVPFMPMRQFRGRKVKLMVRTAYGAGLAAFKADNANTPVVSASGDLQEQYIELVTIAEKETLNASDLIALESIDPNVADRAARTVVEKAQALKQRNINRTRWLAWQAVKDSLSIAYGGVTVSIDWDLDGDGMNSSRISSSHLPTYTDFGTGSEAYAWNHQDDNENYDANVIEGAYYCAKLIADDLGIAEEEVAMHVNSTTYRIIRQNAKVAAELSSYSPRVITPTRPEIAEVLGLADVIIRNDHYWDTSNTKQKFLPDGYALFTPASYEYQGTPIAEMYDGLVARVVNGQIRVEPNPGLVAEMYINQEQVSENVRVQSARMPIVNYPEGIVYAQVY